MKTFSIQQTSTYAGVGIDSESNRISSAGFAVPVPIGHSIFITGKSNRAS